MQSWRTVVRLATGAMAGGEGLTSADHDPRGRLNEHLGWSLLAAGFAWAAWLDPWSLGAIDPIGLAGSRRMATRHAQAVVLAMGLLQLLVARLPPITTPGRRSFGYASRLVAAGGVIYALGYGVLIRSPEGAWLTPLGALLNLAGFSMLAWIAWREATPPALGPVLLVVALGMLLDGVMALFVLRPDVFLPDYIGALDGVRLRMLRLARAAAIALPVVWLLYRDLAVRHGRSGSLARTGGAALVVGILGMPLILSAAGFTDVRLKHLLGLPACAVLLGTLVGARLTWEHGGLLESWGWWLVAAGMTAGMAMGVYAFDGPLRSPAFLGAYNDFPRRVSRLAHAYAIVLGLTTIFVARRASRGPGPHRLERGGHLLLVSGTATALLALVALPMGLLPAALLRVGPAMVAAALVMCVTATAPAGPAEGTIPGGRSGT